MADRGDAHKEIDRLIADGELRQAAAALRGQGDLSRAQELYERVWDLESAAAIAHERGDRLGLLRIALQRQDLTAAVTLGQYFKTATAGEQREAAKRYEEHRLYAEAGALRQALGELEEAAALYQRGEAWLLAARLNEARGRWHEAINEYGLVLSAGLGTGAERVDAALLRGKLLLRCWSLEEALLQLQEARRLCQQLRREQQDTGAELDAIEAHMLDCLVAMGEVDVARPVLRSYAERRAKLQGVSSSPDDYTDPVEFVHRRAGRAAQASAPAGDSGLLLGRYRILRLLGVGSMGRVYLAEDDARRRQVALKLLPLAAASGRAHRQLYQRFCREAELLKALRHPNLIELHEFHAAAGLLSMEYMPGGALVEARLPLPLSLLRRVLGEVVEALLVVHSAGVLHRDIKPHNLFLSPTGAAKLADFGAASLRELGLTQTEGLVGTLAYMAPEQLRGQELSFATDVYGLGVTAFELCTGRLPYPGPDFIEQHLSAAPPDPRQLRPDLPQPWAALLQQLLAKNSSTRCTDLESLRVALLRLPTPALPGEQDVQARAAMVRSAAPKNEEPVKESGTSLLGSTGYSFVFLGSDARLGRPVFIERFAEGLLQGDAGQAHLSWLRGMARLAGPGLQHILRIDLHSQPSAQVYFEAPPSTTTAVSSREPLSPAEKEQASRVLNRLHQGSLVHGGVEEALVREPGQILLLLSGRGPLSWSSPPRPSDDLTALESLTARP